jgi:hypothetical protein
MCTVRWNPRVQRDGFARLPDCAQSRKPQGCIAALLVHKILLFKNFYLVSLPERAFP